MPVLAHQGRKRRRDIAQHRRFEAGPRLDATNQSVRCGCVSSHSGDMLGLSPLWEETRPHLTDWFRRVKARPGFEAAMLRYVPPPLAALMRQHGAAALPAVRAVLRDAGVQSGL